VERCYKFIYFHIKLHISGIARISKLGAHRWRGTKGRCGGWGFWGGAAQRAPSPSAQRSGEELSLPPPLPPKISSDLHESCGHACRR